MNTVEKELYRPHTLWLIHCFFGKEDDTTKGMSIYPLSCSRMAE